MLALLLVTALTGGPNLPSNADFGDPSPPYQDARGVHILTTGGEDLIWPSWDALLAGRPARHERLELYHSDGVTRLDPQEFGEDGWDPAFADDDLLYAGVMTPTEGRKNARWPEDHWNRRTYAFRRVKGRWIREPRPLVGYVPHTPTWIGHNYGHSRLKLPDGRVFLFYEKVTEERNGLPWLTEIFAREMKDAFTLKGKEISVLKVGHRKWPSIYREFGGKLVEGPRAFLKDGKILVAFSAGDYMSDDYGMHLLEARDLHGPYRAIVEGGDLRNFGEVFERERPMTWGAARPAYFHARGEWWVLFHGIEEGEPEGLRNVYLSRIGEHFNTEAGSPLRKPRKAVTQKLVPISSEPF